MSKIHEVIAIIDRSGSMAGKEDDTISGINSTFEILKTEMEEDTQVKVSIKLFDHEEEMLFHSLDLNELKPITRNQYRVRGQTALLDAMGNTLDYFMEKKKLDTNAYHSCTIYVVTDGIENSSKKYTSQKIKHMISEADNLYNIKILYLGANQDAILEANKYGICLDQALNYSENSDNVQSAYRAAASAASRHASGQEIAFTLPERSASQTPNYPILPLISPPVDTHRTRPYDSPPRVKRQNTGI